MKEIQTIAYYDMYLFKTSQAIYDDIQANYKIENEKK